MTLYDEVLYPSFPIYYTHPNRLATIATLLGMKPAPVDQCRVLEIGCFDGVNLAAMAIGLPDSEFVGVDLASTAIVRGCAMAKDLGLKNLVLRHADVMEMAPDYGEFDYIIAHGVYTWVPSEVARHIMAICKGSLAPQGVAYISYNTLPGCHVRLMIREMMQFHNRDFHDPRQQMQQGLNLLKVLANSLQNEKEFYPQFLKAEFQRLSQRSLEALYHDELSEIFAPLYFHQFMEQAQQQNLQFLGEADFFDMMPRGLTPKAVEVLDRISGDIVLREQYLDFMRGRFFRKSLLCHPDIAVNRNAQPDSVRSFAVSTLAKGDSSGPNPDPGAKETFQSSAGAEITSAAPLARAMFWYLEEKTPERVPFERMAMEVEQRAREFLGYVPEPGADSPTVLAEFVWNTYCAGLVDLHLHRPPCVGYVSEKPVASPLARWQARQNEFVATLNHKTLKLGSPVQRGVLALLDGTRDRAALHKDVLAMFASGELDLLNENGEPIREMTAVAKVIGDELEDFLQKAALAAVLTG